MIVTISEKKKQKKKKETKKKKKTEEKNKEPKLSVRRVWSNNLFALSLVAKAAPWYLPIWFGWSILGALCGFLSGSYVLRLAINNVQKGEDIKKTLLYIIAIALFELLHNLLTQLASRFLLGVYRIRIQTDIKNLMFEKAKKVELSCYERPEFYDQYVRAMDEAENRVFEVVNNVDNVLWRISYLSFNSLLLYTIDPVLIIFGVLPVLFGLLRKIEMKAYFRYVNEQKPNDRKKDYIRRVFYQNDYAKEMRLTNMAQSMYRDYVDCFSEFKRILKKNGRLRTLVGIIIECGMRIFAFLGAILYSLYRTLISGTMLYGDCMVVINSILGVSYSIERIMTGLSSFRDHAMYIENMRYLLDYSPAISENENGEIPRSGGVLVFEHVSFSYEGQKGKAVDDLSFTLHYGEKIALVGLNGSGKSTIVKLILHLYEPIEGRILYDGKDIREYKLSAYRALFSAVFQDCKNFSATVAENVMLSRVSDADKPKVERALKESGAWDKISSFEKGLDTTLTKEFDEHGEVLSGGETQKVQLARIFAENRSFAIMDEPSSALDPIAECKMFENMMKASEGRTVIFISHRLSSAVTADKILMMREGKLAEEGNHEALLAKGGYYAGMFEKQASNYLGNEVSDDVVV